MTQFENYLKYLKDKKLNRLTIKNYQFYLNRFFEFAKIKKPSDISLKKIQLFINYLSQLKVHYKTLNKATINYHLIALRSFLKYLEIKKIKNIPSANEVKLKKIFRQPVTLTKLDLEKLLEAPRKFNNPEIIKTRDKAILELLFSTGLKVSKIAYLTIKNIDLVKNQITLASRIFELSNQAKFWLKDYLKMRTDNIPSLFISHDRASRLRNKPVNLSARSIQRLVEKYAKSVGLTKKVTPQTLRQAYANKLLSQGLEVKEVQKKLGHKHINTTNLIYKG